MHRLHSLLFSFALGFAVYTAPASAITPREICEGFIAGATNILESLGLKAPLGKIPEPFTPEQKPKILRLSGYGIGARRTFVYVPANQAYSGKLLHLSPEEYRKRAQEESIEPDTILLLDRIDLEVDPPLVAGIIIKTPLSAEGTHIQVLAEKMDVPLVYAQDFEFSDYFFTNEANKSRYFSLKTSEETVYLDAVYGMLKFRTAKPSVLPKDFQRAQYADWVQNYRPTDSYHRDYEPEIIGEKYRPLAEFKHRHFSLVPSIGSATSMVFEELKTTAKQDGKTLAEFILEQLISIETAKPEETRQKLESIRKAIETWPSEEFDIRAKRIWGLLDKGTGKKSIRSNNEVEDLLAAGMYASGTATNLEGFKKAMRKIYASQYTYRAYVIRRAWGQREKNQSMPLLIHPYVEVGPKGFNGVVRAKILPSGELDMEFNVVLGESHSTNPSADAKTFKFHLKGSNAKLVGRRPPRELLLAAKEFYLQVIPTLQRDLLERKIPPENIEMEMVFEGKDESHLKPWVLQYKFGYSREIALAVIEGSMPRSELNEWNPKPLTGPNTLEGLAEKLSLTQLKDFLPYSNGGRHQTRYALVKVGEEYGIVLWSNGRYHHVVRGQIRWQTSAAIWLRSGYLYLDNGKLAFSDANIATRKVSEYEDNRIAISFKEALAQATSANGDFSAWIRRHQPVTVTFNPGKGPFVSFEQSYSTPP